MKIWAVLSLVYAAVVLVLAITKPAAIWKMKKIQLFEKVLGVKGTEVFFYVWALAFMVLGVWLLTR
ncbi:hypothetical protein QBE53_04315 [Vallitaleaceae bacterium 9-2]